MNNILKEKLKFKIAISQMKMEEEKNMMKKKPIIFKDLGIAACLLLFLTGGAFAGNKIIESIWKEPEEVEYSDEITQDVRDKNISIDEAKLKAIDILEKFNFNTNIVEYEEIKDGTSDKLTYRFHSEDNYSVNIDGETGKFYDMWNDNYFISDNIPLISDEEAIKIANEYCLLYGVNLDEYEISKVWVGNNPSISDGEDEIVTIGYNKKYNDILNPFDYISVCIGSGENGLRSFRIESQPFDNNEIILSKDDAISVALEEDKKIETNNIESVDAKLMIVQMNTDAYERIHNKEDYYKSRQTLNYSNTERTYYSIDSRIRNAWVVTITYVDDYGEDISRRYTEGKYSYFVDTTTGEIIGGDNSYSL